MKEIDFLPNWYKNVRRQQVTYRTQYVALGGLFVIMLVSNFVTGRSISRVQAHLTGLEEMEAASKNVSVQYAGVAGQIAELEKKSAVLKQIDSRINVGDVLAELSFLVGKKVVLTRVELTAEKFNEQQSSNAASGFAVRPAGFGRGGKEELFLGDVKFKVVLGGIAADASEVGEFVCRLEDSPYFCTVYPAFTRNKQIKIAVSSSESVQSPGRISRGQEGSIQLNEFEIGCYLANFMAK
jgi:hypothetical protein